MKTQKLTILAMTLTLLSGCATITEGSRQPLQVITSNNQDIPRTVCRASNEEGTWTLVDSKPSTIHRDGNPMMVTCENPAQKGAALAMPRFQMEYFWMDICLDLGLISLPIDAANNSLYEYNVPVRVEMR